VGREEKRRWERVEGGGRKRVRKRFGDGRAREVEEEGGKGRRG